MKSARHLVIKLRDWLIQPRVTLALILALILLFLVTIASELFASKSLNGSAMASAIQSISIESSVWRWFIFGVLISALNLILRIRGHQGDTEFEAFFRGKSRGGRRCVRAVIDGRISREGLRKWIVDTFGTKPEVSEDEDFVLKMNRVSRGVSWILAAGVILMVFGTVLSRLTGTEIAFRLKEGESTELNFQGHSLKISCERFERPSAKSWIKVAHWYDPDSTELELSRGRPAKFEGLVFHELGYADSRQSKAWVTVLDQQDKNERVYGPLAKDSEIDEDGLHFKVLEVQDRNEDEQKAIQLAYFEPGRKKPEKFWIFEDLPDLDLKTRKWSRFHFLVREIQPLYEANLNVTHSYGSGWVWLGALLSTLSVALFFWWPEKRYLWSLSANRVQAVGYSPNWISFRAEFHEAARDLAQKLGGEAAEVKDDTF